MSRQRSSESTDDVQIPAPKRRKPNRALALLGSRRLIHTISSSKTTPSNSAHDEPTIGSCHRKQSQVSESAAEEDELEDSNQEDSKGSRHKYSLNSRNRVQTSEFQGANSEEVDELESSDEDVVKRFQQRVVREQRRARAETETGTETETETETESEEESNQGQWASQVLARKVFRPAFVSAPQIQTIAIPHFLLAGFDTEQEWDDYLKGWKEDIDEHDFVEKYINLSESREQVQIIQRIHDTSIRSRPRASDFYGDSEEEDEMLTKVHKHDDSLDNGETNERLNGSTWPALNETFTSREEDVKPLVSTDISNIQKLELSKQRTRACDFIMEEEEEVATKPSLPSLAINAKLDRHTPDEKHGIINLPPSQHAQDYQRACLLLVPTVQSFPPPLLQDFFFSPIDSDSTHSAAGSENYNFQLSSCFLSNNRNQHLILVICKHWRAAQNAYDIISIDPSKYQVLKVEWGYWIIDGFSLTVNEHHRTPYDATEWSREQNDLASRSRSFKTKEGLEEFSTRKQSIVRASAQQNRKRKGNIRFQYHLLKEEAPADDVKIVSTSHSNWKLLVYPVTWGRRASTKQDVINFITLETKIRPVSVELNQVSPAYDFTQAYVTFRSDEDCQEAAKLLSGSNFVQWQTHRLSGSRAPRDVTLNLRARIKQQSDTTWISQDQVERRAKELI